MKANEKSEVRAAFADDATLADAAKHLGCSIATAAIRRDAARLPTSREIRKRRFVALFAELDGMSLEDQAPYFGVRTKQAVADIARRYKVSRTDMRKRKGTRPEADVSDWSEWLDVLSVADLVTLTGNSVRGVRESVASIGLRLHSRSLSNRSRDRAIVKIGETALSQKELATLVGVSQTRVSRILAKNRNAA